MPTKAVCLDYETYYIKSKPTDPGYSVARQGNWRYCNDERFDPYMLSVFDGSNSWVGNPKNFNWEAVRGDLLIAHNAGFDSAVSRRLVELGLAPSWVASAPWQCTANMTSYLFSARALADAVLVAEGRHISKADRDWMNGKTWADAVAAGKADDIARYALADARECHGLWTKYSDQWPQFERDLSLLTMKQCERGVRIDIPLLEVYRGVLQEVIFNLERSLPWTESGAKPTSPKAIAEQCRTVGIPAPPFVTKDEEGFIAWQAEYGPKYPWVWAVSQWRSLGKLLSTLDTIKERLRPDGTIDFSLLYFGGHTGRWSGGGSGLNLQNLKKIPIFIKAGNVVEPPKNVFGKAFSEWVDSGTDFQLDVRKLFIAREGKKFVLCDLAQIEPRVLAWLTKNTDFLALMSQGMSPYEAFARTSMGWTGGNLKKENPEMYQLSKIQILGLGYGCGDEKFIDIAAGYEVILTPEQSTKIVTDFRSQNPLIAGKGGIWKQLDGALKDSINTDFNMGLPSGRSLNYRSVLRCVRTKKNKETGKPEPRFVYTAGIGSNRVETYGGKLTENITQAVARDVFGEHLLTLEEKVGDVIFHVHDEAIVEVDLDVTTKEVEAVMSVCPASMPGLPVAAEAQESQHYTK